MSLLVLLPFKNTLIKCHCVQLMRKIVMAGSLLSSLGAMIGAENHFQSKGIMKTSACISDFIILYVIPKLKPAQHSSSTTVTSSWTAPGKTSEGTLATFFHLFTPLDVANTLPLYSYRQGTGIQIDEVFQHSTSFRRRSTRRTTSFDPIAPLCCHHPSRQQ